MALTTPVRLLLMLGFVLVVGAVGAFAPWRRPNNTDDNSAGSHWQQALQALAQDDFVLARAHLTRCLQVWPINAEAHFLLARTCRRAGDVAGWQVNLRRAEILGWDTRPLGLERELMEAQSGNLRHVENRLLGRLDSSSPDEELIREALAKGYLKTDDLNGLLVLTRTWISRFADDWRAHLFRARALQLARSVHQAIPEYERVLQLKPDHVEAHFELAGALLVNSQFQEAAEHFRAYLQHDANDVAALVRLANCELSLGQVEAAQTTLDRAFSIRKDDAAAFYVRAKLDLTQSRPQEALQWLKQAERLAPHETDITYALVLVHQQLGKQAEAKEYERKLQDLRRQYEQLDKLRQGIHAQPDNIALRDEAGALSLRLGHQEEAEHWLRTALQLDPEHRPTHRLLAEYFEKLGKAESAAYHRRKSEGK
jgi:tetratricopeptide (TPR) repeat protein